MALLRVISLRIAQFLNRALPYRRFEVFLSSTSKMKEERAAVTQTLNGDAFLVWDYAEEPARGVSPEEHCRRHIELSHIFLGVLGGDYGSLYPGEQRSIVEWEYDTARSIRSRSHEVMMFVKDIAPTQIEQPQAEFRRKVQTFHDGVWTNSFNSTGKLVTEVIHSTAVWLKEFQNRLQRQASYIGRTGYALLAVFVVALPFILAHIADQQAQGAWLKSTASYLIGLAIGVIGAALVFLILGKGGSNE